MIKIIFKNLEKSELAKDAVTERLEPIYLKFPELKKDLMTFTLSMENSPIQSGPDLFKVKMQLSSGQYKGVVLERSAANLYNALAEVVEKIHERLKRKDEKTRNIQRNHQRRKKEIMVNHSDSSTSFSAIY